MYIHVHGTNLCTTSTTRSKLRKLLQYYTYSRSTSLLYIVGSYGRCDASMRAAWRACSARALRARPAAGRRHHRASRFLEFFQIS